jgi:hypothetical protein
MQRGIHDPGDFISDVIDIVVGHVRPDCGDGGNVSGLLFGRERHDFLPSSNWHKGRNAPARYSL